MPHSLPPMSDIILRSSQSAVTGGGVGEADVCTSRGSPRVAWSWTRCEDHHSTLETNIHFWTNLSWLSFLGRLDFYNGREKKIRYKFSDTCHEETFIFFFWICNPPPTMYLGEGASYFQPSLFLGSDYFMKWLWCLLCLCFVPYLFSMNTQTFSINIYSTSMESWLVLDTTLSSEIQWKASLEFISLSRALQKYGYLVHFSTSSFSDLMILCRKALQGNW